MSNPTLKNLLKEYEQKRLNALIDLDKRKMIYILLIKD